jgi:hypothetical protein
MFVFVPSQVHNRGLAHSALQMHFLHVPYVGRSASEFRKQVTNNVREARFVRNPDGTPDGQVHGLYVIAGRPVSPGRDIVRPNFAAELAANNVIFRIQRRLTVLDWRKTYPTSLFKRISQQIRF